jgi:hypothetical protein
MPWSGQWASPRTGQPCSNLGEAPDPHPSHSEPAHPGDPGTRESYPTLDNVSDLPRHGFISRLHHPLAGRAESYHSERLSEDAQPGRL